MTEPPLLIRLYLDEDVSILIAALLHPHGFDVLTTRDAKNRSQSDCAQLRFAAEQQRAILTHNRLDYEALHATALRERQAHAEILIANRRASDFDLAKRIMKLLNTFIAEDIVNQLLYL